MLEVTLAVSVIAAVVVVGLLISLGNERQRRALEELNQYVSDWAIGDLRIKRARAAREIQIERPVEWLEEMARLAMGASPALRDVVRVHQNPEAIEVATDGEYILVYSPVEPRRLKRLSKNGGKKGVSLTQETPLLGKKPGRVNAYELSVLNAGVFFDIEADQVWRQITHRPLSAHRLWIYAVEAPWAGERT
jgi:hypothetical protein